MAQLILSTALVYLANDRQLWNVEYICIYIYYLYEIWVNCTRGTIAKGYRWTYIYIDSGGVRKIVVVAQVVRNTTEQLK